MRSDEGSQLFAVAAELLHESLHHDADPVERAPDHDESVQTVPDVDENERDRASHNFARPGRGLRAELGVNVSEQELVQAAIKELPHVRVEMNAPDADGFLGHVYAVEPAERDPDSVKDDVLDVEELAHQVAATVQNQRLILCRSC